MIGSFPKESPAVTSPLRAFLKVNKELSGKLGKYLSKNKDLYLLHDMETAACRGVGLDVGAGRRARSNGCIASDLSTDELQYNPSASRVCLDASASWPFQPESLDFVTSRWTLEHLPKTETFFLEASTALRVNGRFVHLLACRYSLIATLGRLLPHSVSHWLLRRFFPESKDICGFEAHYDLCWPDALRRLCQEHRLAVERIELNYMQAWYFSFFVPLFLLCLGFDWSRRLLHMENTCHCLLLVARKVGSRGPISVPPSS